MQTTLWHNPRCSKSRQTLELLKAQGITPSIRLYLQDPPSQSELATVLKALDFNPRQLIRTKESEYKELGLQSPGISDNALLEAMVSHPRLIERPIVLHGERAAVGRPPENVLEIL
jgi:arsenate reductase (glutaredoxin)